MRIKNISLVAALALGAGTLHATTYTDVDRVGQWLDLVPLTIFTPSSYTGNFNIATGDGDSGLVISGFPAGNGTFSDVPGFVVGTDTATSGTASFYLSFANDYELVTVDLGLSGSGNASFFGTTITLSGALSGTSISVLNNNGALNYTVSLAQGSQIPLTGVKLDYAKLTVEATRDGAHPNDTQPTGVPDGGSTVMLLGLALGGLGFMRRNTR